MAAWLKRNLLLVIGGAVALVLLALGGLYCASGLQKNRQLDEELSKDIDTLQRLYSSVPFPAKSNVDQAQALIGRVRGTIAESKKLFVPVPFTNVTDQQFKTLLDNTIAELTRAAQQARVQLPETNYAFTFRAQKALVKFASGSLPALSQMLADIRHLCGLVFDARCNLVNLRRERISTDDPPGSTDFTELRHRVDPVTEALIVPYEVVVSGFSPQLANLLQKFAQSPHGFLVKVMAVEPLSGQAAEVKHEPARWGAPAAGPPGAPPPTAPPPPSRLPRTRRPLPPRAAATGPVTEASDNPVVLIEQQLKATLLVYAVKPGQQPFGAEPPDAGPSGPRGPRPRRARAM
jgi:hypothetical protein